MRAEIIDEEHAPVVPESRLRSLAGEMLVAPPSLVVLALVPLVFLALPLVALVVKTLPVLGDLSAEGRADLWQALRLSLVTTAITAGLILLFGIPASFLLARRRFPGLRLVNALIDLPIVLPPAVAGIALLMAFGRKGLLGGWLADLGITVGFSTAAVVLAQCFVAAPLFIRAARVGFQMIDPDLEGAAALDGASPLAVMLTITLPLAQPSLIAGIVLAWARALGEFGATIMFAGNFPGVTQTMPLAIYARFGSGDLTSALILSTVLLAASLLVLLGVRLIGDHPATS
jgi:molybdate transport system permease protein